MPINHWMEEAASQAEQLGDHRCASRLWPSRRTFGQHDDESADALLASAECSMADDPIFLASLRADIAVTAMSLHEYTRAEALLRAALPASSA